MYHESYPSVLPRPSVKPILNKTDKKLTLTPEKLPKAVKECPRPLGKENVKKKVMFKEIRATSTDEDCQLAKPSLHTTNMVTREILRNREETFDMSKALKEIQMSDSVQNAICKEVTSTLNYRLTDRKYQNLPSLDVPEETYILKTRSKYKEREKDESLKPDIMDLYCQADIVTEKGKEDFKIDVQPKSDIVQEKESFEFLFDLYKVTECTQSEHKIKYAVTKTT